MITDQDVAAYKRDGVIVVPDVLLIRPQVR